MTTSVTHLEQAALDAAESELAPLLDRIVGRDDDGEDVLVAQALADALLVGVRLGAVEVLAQLIEAGHDVGPLQIVEAGAR